MSKSYPIVIIGAGPAGLTAAYELARRTKKEIIVIESEGEVGGISKTVDHKGNKIDIGGHRFFSKSEWVLEWWQQFMPIKADDKELMATYQGVTKSVKVKPHAGSLSSGAMLVRPRKSRIIYKGHLFDYPLKLNLKTFWGIGLFRSLAIISSLLYHRMIPVKPEKNLEDFYINRFGKVLYKTFFEDYTRKVWGRSCHEIDASWGYQRVKGLSFRSILKHYFATLFFPSKQLFGSQKVENSLTEYFLYPEKGPGQLWGKVAQKCQDLGVQFRFHQQVTELTHTEGKISHLKIFDKKNHEEYTLTVDQVISTMPVRSLMKGLSPSAPDHIHRIALGLEYRAFIIVGLLLKDLKLQDQHAPIKDNWLYVQDDRVQVGRVQLFHNWSPFMTADPKMNWLGAEYFCDEDDDLWNLSDQELLTKASEELQVIGLIDAPEKLNGKIVRMPKAYPSYVGTYQQFGQVRSFLDQFENLFLIGRNGTHRYNNQDHSMLTALEAVKAIVSGIDDKRSIWNVNTEKSYHEEIQR